MTPVAIMELEAAGNVVNLETGAITPRVVVILPTVL